MLDSSKIWTPKPLNLRNDEGFSSNPNSPENQEAARYAVPAPPPGLYNYTALPLTPGLAKKKTKDPKAAIHVKNLPTKATRELVYKNFTNYGKIATFDLPKSNFGAGNKGFAFIHFVDKQVAIELIKKETLELMFEGQIHHLHISEYIEKRAESPTDLKSPFQVENNNRRLSSSVFDFNTRYVQQSQNEIDIQFKFIEMQRQLLACQQKNVDLERQLFEAQKRNAELEKKMVDMEAGVLATPRTSKKSGLADLEEKDEGFDKVISKPKKGLARNVSLDESIFSLNYGIN